MRLSSSSRATARTVYADAENPALNMDRKLLGTSN